MAVSWSNEQAPTFRKKNPEIYIGNSVFVFKSAKGKKI